MINNDGIISIKLSLLYYKCCLFFLVNLALSLMLYSSGVQSFQPVFQQGRKRMWRVDFYFHGTCIAGPEPPICWVLPGVPILRLREGKRSYFVGRGWSQPSMRCRLFPALDRSCGVVFVATVGGSWLSLFDHSL